MAICTIPGMLLVILAPGNYARAEFDGNSDMLKFDSFLNYIKLYWTRFENQNSFIIRTAFIIFIFAFVISQNKKTNIFKQIHENVLIFSGIAGVLALSVLGYYSHRPVIFGYVVFLAGFIKMAVKMLHTVPKLLNEKKFLFTVQSTLITLGVYFAFKSVRSGDIEGMILYAMCFLMFIISAAACKKAKISDIDREKLEKLKALKNKLKGKIKYICVLSASVICIAVIAAIGKEFGKYRSNIKLLDEYYAELNTAQSLTAALETANEYNIFFPNDELYFPPTVHNFCSDEYFVVWYIKYYEQYVKPDTAAAVTPRCLS